MRKFTKNHEWVEFNDGTVTIGISAYAAKELGDITYVELPEVDEDVEVGDAFCVVESVKAASDVYAPVSGLVCEVNEDLEDEPELVNSSAEENGWICRVSGVDASDLDEMMDEAEYNEFIKE